MSKPEHALPVNLLFETTRAVTASEHAGHVAHQVLNALLYQIGSGSTRAAPDTRARVREMSMAADVSLDTVARLGGVFDGVL